MNPTNPTNPTNLPDLLKVTLDLMDEQDPTRKILQSAADDFMAIVAAGGPQSRLA